MTIASSRLTALNRTRCSIFQASYNPKNKRVGTKYLSTPLRGPSLVKYYPSGLDLARIEREHLSLEFLDLKQQQRARDADERRRRGKGPPKKLKEGEESRRAKQKRQ